MHHAPCTMHHASCTKHQATCTMHHAPCTMHHAPCTMQHATCNMRYEPWTMNHELWTMTYGLISLWTTNYEELWTMNWCTCGAELTSLSKVVPNFCKIIIMLKPFYLVLYRMNKFGNLLYSVASKSYSNIHGNRITLTNLHSYLHIFLGRWLIQRSAFQ